MLGLAVLIVCVVAVPAAAAKPKLPPAKKATVKQVASLVATYRADLLTDIANVDSGCLITSCTQIGRLQLSTLAAQARTLSINLDLMDDRVASNKSYIGTAPKQLVSLVADTRAALDSVYQQHLAVGACLNTPASCAGELGAAYATRLTLKQELNAWSPYVT